MRQTLGGDEREAAGLSLLRSYQGGNAVAKLCARCRFAGDRVRDGGDNERKSASTAGGPHCSSKTASSEATTTYAADVPMEEVAPTW